MRVREIAARAAFLAALATAAAGSADAQGSGEGRRGLAGSASADSGVPFERGVARVVQRQLGLSPAQLTRLEQVDRRFRQQQRQKQREEAATRRELRQALAGTTAADSARLGPLVDRLVDLQGERVALLKAEQGELRQFLSPVQRARYLGIQEFVRRRAEELRAKPGGAGTGGGRAAIPFGRRQRP